MTFLLFLIFAIVIFGIMFLLSIVRGVSSFIFGKPSSSQGYTSNHASSAGKTAYNNQKSHRKVFSKEEGEYVKYEEIKD
ncbi:DUF4834 family protein [Prevotella sp. 10(H)]|uniref:DUF4834 family protein n=1 Tax=Prevotella sp. 10(H) TaxID=1158294 RepID=UPI0004A77397|nr:DUF4834 family protein [Prevotella sp. 10(H)]